MGKFVPLSKITMAIWPKTVEKFHSRKKCVLILVLLLYKWNTYYRWKFTIHLMLCKTFHKSFKVSSFIFHITNYTKWTTAKKHWKKRRTRSNRCEFCSCWHFLWETSFVLFLAILMIENLQTIFMHFPFVRLAILSYRLYFFALFNVGFFLVD